MCVSYFSIVLRRHVTKATYRRKTSSFSGLESLSLMVGNMRAVRQAWLWGSSSHLSPQAESERACWEWCRSFENPNLIPQGHTSSFSPSSSSSGTPPLPRSFFLALPKHFSQLDTKCSDISLWACRSHSHSNFHRGLFVCF